jgi:hypothetical protein
MARRGAFIMALIWATSSSTALRAVGGGSTVSGFLGSFLFFASSAAARLAFLPRPRRGPVRQPQQRLRRPAQLLGPLGFSCRSSGFSFLALGFGFGFFAAVAVPARRPWPGRAFGFSCALLAGPSVQPAASLFLRGLRFDGRVAAAAPQHALRLVSGLVTLDEGALLAHFHLDGARLAGCIGLLDLGGFLGQRDLLLAFRRGAVRAAQVFKQLSLSSFDNGSDANFLDAGRTRWSAGLQASSARWQIGLRCYSPFSPLFYVSRR